LYELNGSRVVGFSQIFLNSWYRVSAVLSVVLVAPLTYGVILFSQKGRHRLIRVFVLCLTVSITLGTGFSILRTAWNRPSLVSPSVMSQFDQLRKYSGLRTLNSPNDGSSWAYARSGLSLVAPNDRSADLAFVDVLNDLRNPRTRFEACEVIREKQIKALLAVGVNQDIFDVLVADGVIKPVLLKSNDLSFGMFSSVFLNRCDE
jgi:hypothetical protein